MKRLLVLALFTSISYSLAHFGFELITKQNWGRAFELTYFTFIEIFVFVLIIHADKKKEVTKQKKDDS